MAAWLIEAAIVASGSDSRVLQAIAQSPALFPFANISINITQLAANDRLELFRQGLDEDMVMLRESVSKALHPRPTA